MTWKKTPEEDSRSVSFPLGMVSDTIPEVIQSLKHWALQPAENPLYRVHFSVQISSHYWSDTRTMLIDIGRIDDRTTKVHVYCGFAGEGSWGDSNCRQDIAIFLVALQEALAGKPIPPPPKVPIIAASPSAVTREREIIKEIIKVRCSHCGNLCDETNDRCPNCGGPLH